MVYKRKHLISNLFIYRDLLNKFDIIEFDNIDSFLESLDKNYFSFSKESKRLILNINTQYELDLFKTFLLNIEDVDKENIIFIRPKFDIDITHIKEIKNKKFFILVDYNEEKTSYYKKLNDEFDNIIIYTEININNYNIVMNNIPNLLIQYSLSNYLFNINYFSFEELKLKDLHKLEFFINNLSYWSDKLNYNKGDILLKECYVTSDFKIYPNYEAFVDNFYIFDLKKYMGIGPEKIPYKDLNTLLSYIDIPQKQFFDIKGNLRLINLYQNYKIFGNYCKLSITAEKFIRRLK